MDVYRKEELITFAVPNPGVAVKVIGDGLQESEEPAVNCGGKP